MDVISLLDSVSLLFENYGYFIIFLGALIEITPLAWAVPATVLYVTVTGCVCADASTIPNRTWATLSVTTPLSLIQ